MSAERTSKADEVRAFVAASCAVDRGRVQPETRLYEDLGVNGDDSNDLLREFAAKFQVDLTGYDHDAHFASEGEFLPWTLLMMLWRLLRQGNLSDGRSPLRVGRLNRAAEDGSWLPMSADS